MMRKGSAIGYSGILAMLIIATFVFIYVTGASPIDRFVISSEGNLINFVNEAELTIKEFDTGMQFISQRAAYDLGKNGGLQIAKYWTEGFPRMEILEEQLEKAIENNMPASSSRGNIEITMRDAEIDTNYGSDCGPIESSECFFVDGSIFMNFYDDSITSRVTLNPYYFDIKTSSNYFKLLNAGRAIMDDARYNVHLDIWGDLLNELNDAKEPSSFSFDSRFENLVFSVTPVGGDIIEVTIREDCYPPDYYCLAPLKEGETGFDSSIPYDYVKLTFRYDKEQTAYVEPDYTFSLSVNPVEGQIVFGE